MDRVVLVGDGEQLGGELLPVGDPAAAVDPHLGEAQMGVEDVRRHARRALHGVDELADEQLAPAAAHVGDHAEQCARLAELAAEAGLGGELASLAGLLLGLVERSAMGAQQRRAEQHGGPLLRRRRRVVGLGERLVVERLGLAVAARCRARVAGSCSAARSTGGRWPGRRRRGAGGSAPGGRLRRVGRPR